MKTLQILSMFLVSLVPHGCSNGTASNPANTANGLNGFIYYTSSGQTIRKINLADGKIEVVSTNAIQPEALNDGSVLAKQPVGPTQLVYISGATKTSLLEQEVSGKFEHREGFQKARVSFDQKVVCYEGTRSYTAVYIIDASNGNILNTIGDFRKKMPYLSPSWAPDGSLFVQGMQSINNGIFRFSPPAFSVPQRIDANLSNVSEPCVSKDGTTIAFIRDEEIWTMGIDGSKPALLRTNLPSINSLTWSPDSKYLAFVSNSSLYVLEISTLKLTQITAVIVSDIQLCWK